MLTNKNLTKFENDVYCMQRWAVHIDTYIGDTNHAILLYRYRYRFNVLQVYRVSISINMFLCIGNSMSN